MMLNELKPQIGAYKKSKRLGRGIGSGKGKTAGKGHKGQRARAGIAIKGFEGGQTPLTRRLPKRGFNPFRKTYYDLVNFEHIVNLVERKNIDKKTLFTKQLLAEHGLISLKNKTKLLAKGELTFALKIEVDAFSVAAEAQVKAAGGEIVMMNKAYDA